MTQQRFCQALSLRPRTLRSWLSHPPRQNERQGPVLRPPPPPPTPRKRGPRRPRFGFDLLLPDTLIAADTTGLSAFGVSLKLVAAQDVGSRDQDLLDSVIIDDHESADLVASVLTDALTGAQGAQDIVDQGTPYMAQRTIDALEEIAVEHAPQPEGDPQAKGTIERAFETVKTLAGPLLRITDGIAQSLPLLRDTALAQAAARLVVISILRACRARPRPLSTHCVATPWKSSTGPSGPFAPRFTATISVTEKATSPLSSGDSMTTIVKNCAESNAKQSSTDIFKHNEPKLRHERRLAGPLQPHFFTRLLRPSRSCGSRTKAASSSAV